MSSRAKLVRITTLPVLEDRVPFASRAVPVQRRRVVPEMPHGSGAKLANVVLDIEALFEQDLSSTDPMLRCILGQNLPELLVVRPLLLGHPAPMVRVGGRDYCSGRLRPKCGLVFAASVH